MPKRAKRLSPRRQARNLSRSKPRTGIARPLHISYYSYSLLFKKRKTELDEKIFEFNFSCNLNLLAHSRIAFAAFVQ